ncbi:hypothetical protein CPB83DRAFT_896007 [Crepidotus variabilis]|uniref:Uncharacterized protein n=1 Tax=Crepidotus variabilis TaxID=179855 RepID=A0A9P6ECW3_9AGAR|nr:hypothetical protein CPB83DRAFT_896007 [Crepidotus variabilis]
MVENWMAHRDIDYTSLTRLLLFSGGNCIQEGALSKANSSQTRSTLTSISTPLATRKIGNDDVSEISFGAMSLSVYYGEVPSDEERLKVTSLFFQRNYKILKKNSHFRFSTLSLKKDADY